MCVVSDVRERESEGRGQKRERGETRADPAGQSHRRERSTIRDLLRRRGELLCKDVCVLFLQLIFGGSQMGLVPQIRPYPGHLAERKPNSSSPGRAGTWRRPRKGRGRLERPRRTGNWRMIWGLLCVSLFILFLLPPTLLR